MIDIYKLLKTKSQPTDDISREIRVLKNQLEADDYKIIKCMEYQLLNKELPYDIEELNIKRDGLREQINELEENRKGK